MSSEDSNEVFEGIADSADSALPVDCFDERNLRIARFTPLTFDFDCDKGSVGRAGDDVGDSPFVFGEWDIGVCAPFVDSDVSVLDCDIAF